MFVTYCNKNRREKIFVALTGLNVMLDGIKYRQAKKYLNCNYSAPDQVHFGKQHGPRPPHTAPPRVFKGIST
jgi:hypothetical protein